MKYKQRITQVVKTTRVLRLFQPVIPVFESIRSKGQNKGIPYIFQYKQDKIEQSNHTNQIIALEKAVLRAT